MSELSLDPALDIAEHAIIAAFFEVMSSGTQHTTRNNLSLTRQLASELHTNYFRM